MEATGDAWIGQTTMNDHSHCSGYDCDWCVLRCPHCQARLTRTRMGFLSCTHGCVIHDYDLWPGALDRIAVMFAERRRENLRRIQHQKRKPSEREAIDAWNADRYVPMNYETTPRW